MSPVVLSFPKLVLSFSLIASIFPFIYVSLELFIRAKLTTKNIRSEFRKITGEVDEILKNYEKLESVDQFFKTSTDS